MLESWIVPVAIVTGFAVLLLLPLVELALGSVRVKEFFCPFANRSVTVELMERTAQGISRPVKVCACSAFEDPEAIICDRACLETPLGVI